MTPVVDPHGGGDPAWLAARRAALDHVLALVAADPCGDSLVLRGSMAMLAWFGDQARTPGDIDWVVRPSAVMSVDAEDRGPYVDSLYFVRLWPEAAYGAGHGEMWEFEDLDTGGQRALLPPEGLHWMVEARADDRPHLEVVELIRAHPHGAGGVVLDGEQAVVDDTWGYEYEGGSGGARLRVPWCSGRHCGELQLDFAYDEELPEPPILLAVPRVGAATPTVVWAASRRQSLLWKLKWLATDDPKQAKDLYDAVLLAEAGPDMLSAPDVASAPGVLTALGGLSAPDGLTAPGVLNLSGVLNASGGLSVPDVPAAPGFPGVPALAGIRDWRVDWPGGDAGPWLDRLARATAP